MCDVTYQALSCNNGRGLGMRLHTENRTTNTKSTSYNMGKGVSQWPICLCWMCAKSNGGSIWWGTHAQWWCSHQKLLPPIHNYILTVLAQHERKFNCNNNAQSQYSWMCTKLSNVLTSLLIMCTPPDITLLSAHIQHSVQAHSMLFSLILCYVPLLTITDKCSLNCYENSHCFPRP